MVHYKEITIELTNFCENKCKFCSTIVTDDFNKADFRTLEDVKEFIGEDTFEYIILSGGEPLANPEFYKINRFCKTKGNLVILYTNELDFIIYNAHVKDGIHIEANLTVRDNVKMIHIQKRIEQGLEKERPEIKFSRNWLEDCDCNKIVLKADGTIVKSPCKKYKKIKKV